MVAPALLQPRWFSSCSPHAPSSPRLLPAAAKALHYLAPRCACGDRGRNCELLGCSPPSTFRGENSSFSDWKASLRWNPIVSAKSLMALLIQRASSRERGAAMGAGGGRAWSQPQAQIPRHKHPQGPTPPHLSPPSLAACGAAEMQCIFEGRCGSGLFPAPGASERCSRSRPADLAERVCAPSEAVAILHLL